MSQTPRIVEVVRGRTLVVGDIHGCYREFLELLERVKNQVVSGGSTAAHVETVPLFPPHVLRAHSLTPERSHVTGTDAGWMRTAAGVDDDRPGISPGGIPPGGRRGGLGIEIPWLCAGALWPRDRLRSPRAVAAWLSGLSAECRWREPRR